jgi:hypothetical protein
MGREIGLESLLRRSGRKRWREAGKVGLVLNGLTVTDERDAEPQPDLALESSKQGCARW